ncbi:MAG: XTP/dITP diphosphatase [Acidobacteriota bacterium]
MDILIATRNRGKIHEVEAHFKGLSLRIHTLINMAIKTDPVEDGKTIEENAAKKALHYSRETGILVLADDSGLMVDHLNQMPGVFSSRYAGSGATDLEKCRKLLKEMEGVPWEERTARFECVIALAHSGELIATFRGECKGYIALEMKGHHGFGYDPIFYYPPLETTFAELEREEKEKVSHRGAALLLAKKFLEEHYL